LRVSFPVQIIYRIVSCRIGSSKSFSSMPANDSRDVSWQLMTLWISLLARGSITQPVKVGYTVHLYLSYLLGRAFVILSVSWPTHPRRLSHLTVLEEAGTPKPRCDQHWWKCTLLPTLQCYQVIVLLLCIRGPYGEWTVSLSIAL